MLRALARRDPWDRCKRPLLFAAALQKFASGRGEVARRYLGYLRGKSPVRDFNNPSYYEVLEDENYTTYLRSNVRLVEHVAGGKTVSICDIGCGRGQFLAELESAGFGDCVGYEISEAAVREAVHGHVGHIDSLDEIEGRFEVVTLISVLEHIPPEGLDRFLNGVGSLAKDYVVACIPTYPQNMLDFFDNDPTHVNLERREWWDALMALRGFQPQELPPEPLPFVGPFIYRRIDPVYSSPPNPAT